MFSPVFLVLDFVSCCCRIRPPPSKLMVKAWARALSLARAKGLWWQRTNGLGYDVIRGNLTDDVMQACAVRATHWIKLPDMLCRIAEIWIEIGTTIGTRNWIRNCEFCSNLIFSTNFILLLSYRDVGTSESYKETSRHMGAYSAPRPNWNINILIKLRGKSAVCISSKERHTLTLGY